MAGAGAPLVSVIIPAYNAGGFIAEAVESVLEQGMDGVEILVVNDGSPDSDALEAALAPYLDRIRYLDGPHRGLSATRNRGIEAARGEFFAFLDADDRWMPGLLDRQLATLRKTGADLVYCDAVFFGDGAVAGHTVMQHDPSDGEVTLGALLAGRCLVVMSTIVAKAEPVRAASGFDTSLGYCEDFDLWTRMLAAGARFTYHRTALAERRIHDANMSHNRVAMYATVLQLIERCTAAYDVSDRDRRDVAVRMRYLRSELHRARAKKALAGHDGATARDELWAAARTARSIRLMVAAVLFTVAPHAATRLFHGRYAQLGME